MKKTFTLIIITISCILFFLNKEAKDKAFVAIANYGSHSSLEETIKGIKEQLNSRGYVEDKNIRYQVSNVNFDTALIPQMITSLASQKPDLLVVLTTPVAQFAKNKVKGIPIVYADITDPIGAGLIKELGAPEDNITGISEKVDLSLMLDFVKSLMPNAKKIGLLYSTAEANDAALLNSMSIASKAHDMDLVAVPIDSSRDIAMRMQAFKEKVDFIYVGTSGAIQPALPIIVAQANKMNIPIINADSEAVIKKQVLASFGISYQKIGENAGNLVADILQNGKMPHSLDPSIKDHRSLINKYQALKYKLNLPENVQVVE